MCASPVPVRRTAVLTLPLLDAALPFGESVRLRVRHSEREDKRLARLLHMARFRDRARGTGL